MASAQQSPIMGALSGIEKSITDIDAATAAHEKSQSQLQQTYLQTLKDKPQAPYIPSINSNVDTLQALGNPMTILAIFGSLLTRRPMVAALNAASGAMQGMATGWQDHLDAALKQTNLEIERYRIAMESHRDDVNAALAAVQNEASQFHDHIVMDQAKAGLYGNIAQIIDARARMSEAAQNHLDMMQLRRDTLALQTRKADDLAAYRAVQQDIGKEKLGLLKGKTADTVKAKASELQSMSDDLQSSIDAITKDPTLGGAYGAGRRIIGETVGQVFPGAQDKEAARFATNIETLQARLTKPFLQAHYFTGNSAEEMEALVKGLNWRDDPTSTVTSLQKVKDIIDAQIGTIAGATSDVQSQSERLADPLSTIGSQVIQNGWIYENQGGTMVPISPAPEGQ